MKNKSLFRTMCVLLCAVFAFALAGCGNTYTDEDDYANFVKWQARYETAAKELCGKFSAGAIKNAAVAYNAKRATVSAREVNSGYLPAELPESPEYLDVSVYLQKAEAMGF